MTAEPTTKQVRDGAGQDEERKYKNRKRKLRKENVFKKFGRVLPSDRDGPGPIATAEKRRGRGDG